MVVGVAYPKYAKSTIYMHNAEGHPSRIDKPAGSCWVIGRPYLGRDVGPGAWARPRPGDGAKGPWACARTSRVARGPRPGWAFIPRGARGLALARTADGGGKARRWRRWRRALGRSIQPPGALMGPSMGP